MRLKQVRPTFAAPAEIDGKTLPPIEVICHQILTHGIVVVRGWHGDETEFVEFGARFGALERASPRDSNHGGRLFRIASTGENAGVGRYWHCDGFAHSVAPAVLTIYHLERGEYPSAGTAFVDGFNAWIHLDDEIRCRLIDRRWTHVSGSTHPFMLLHPKHRALALSVNLGKMTAIEGMSDTEVQSTILALARELDCAPRYVHNWCLGDILFADNRRMLHRAPSEVVGDRRLWRVSVVQCGGG